MPARGRASRRRCPSTGHANGRQRTKRTPASIVQRQASALRRQRRRGATATRAQSVSGIDGTILPRRIWFETEPAGEVRSGTTDETDGDGIGPNPPGPAGFKRRAAHEVRCFGLRQLCLQSREHPTLCASDGLTISPICSAPPSWWIGAPFETELIPSIPETL